MAKENGKKAPTNASKILRSGTVSEKSKAAASSALSQLQNPRSGRFVKVDRATGTIVAHKQTSGAYRGVPIAGKGSQEK